ncbi:MAG TPA: arginine--tRNA ligase [Candidatus Paceibacterota bacterium]|jgi:arginyl-tRNA synthetase|nr:arginine--tRNA ligase [Candidatus Paceibacterota bacterium]
MEERIRNAAEGKLAELGASEVNFAVEWPADMEHGDFAVNAALAASKQLGMSPKEVAEQLAPAIKDALGEDASRVEVAGPGFINITLSPAAISSALTEAVGDAWGTGSAHAGTRIMVEYFNLNPYKEMHIGHLMSTIIGEAVSRLMESAGAQVIRDTYGGDVGPHVAKALWGLRDAGKLETATAEDIGKAYAHGSRAYEKSEKAKEEIDTLNKSLYAILAKDPAELQGDERTLWEAWLHGREVSIEAYRELWTRLGAHFDYTIFESETTPIGMRIVQDELANGVFEQSEGAVIYRGEKAGLHTRVFITSHGTPTYETKDIGLAFWKEERVHPDQVYILTAAEQTGHFDVVIAALREFAPQLASKMAHIPHGFLRLATGKMSSREGNVITAEELLREVSERASEKNEDPLVAEQVALGAIKYMILRQAAGGDIVFDMEKSLSLEGDSGPYLQYALVRANSILAASTQQPAERAAFEGEAPLLARLITRFPEVVARAEALRAPHILTTYLTQLAGQWNSYYMTGKIIGSDGEANTLALVRAFVTTMRNGLNILAIPAPEKM